MRHVIEHLEHIQRLTRGRDRDSVDATFVEVLRALLDARRVALVQVVPTDDGERLWTRVSMERGWTEPQSASVLAALEQGPLLAADAAIAQALAQRRTLALTDTGGVRVVVPVVTDSADRLAIVVECDACASGADWAVRLVEGLARIYENFINLLDSSERDTLTGLLNRESFDDTFYRATQPGPAADDAADPRRHRGGDAYWLAVVDVDHFKSVNDRFGHLIGDEVVVADGAVAA
ncbi:diguanylate cyclase [Tepidimonas charontis]|uniref:diguanylate cyclase n=1 Tax=Tepidimonas charontis TaxID=2267262 RepID=A0A554XJY6_9BURK|nr:diguanylate cyclase [Tepidimonas charontis]TSE36144.1 Diguanylate cyclase VdcA [Tepidimonas charontis]